MMALLFVAATVATLLPALLIIRNAKKEEREAWKRHEKRWRKFIDGEAGR